MRLTKYTFYSFGDLQPVSEKMLYLLVLNRSLQL